MITTNDLNTQQRQSLKGLVDAAVPNCPARVQYFKYAETMGFDGAIWYLRSVQNANFSTVDLLESFLAGIK